MATSPDYYSTYDHSRTVSNQSGDSESSEVTQKTHAMEVKGDLITSHDLQAGQDSKQRVERISELQERRRSLQSLLNTRLSELRRVCLQEAELIGEVPPEFPLEVGERPPFVRRRVGSTRHGPKHTGKGEDEEASQRKLKKTLFSGALRRHNDSEQQPSHGKRTVHRGCHTDNAVKSESSSTSDSTGQDNDEVFSPDCLSPARARVAQESPDSRFCRKLSPVEIYYEMRTRRNSVASSASPNRSLPRSVSNLEGRSVPATPLLSRTGPATAHIRSEVSATKQWSDNPEAPQVVPLQTQEGSSSGSLEQSGSYSAQTRRSNSSEALLDRAVSVDDGAPQRNGMPARGGPYKSSEALTDGRLRQAQRGSPDRQPAGHSDPNRNRTSVGGRTGGGNYNEILLDYVWGKQQKMQAQQQQQQQQQRMQPHVNGKPRPWPEGSSGPPLPQYNGFPPPSQPLHLSGGPPAYSPHMLRGKPGEPRRVKVTRTKSCGPFIPLQQHQQETILLSAYSENPPATNGSSPLLCTHSMDPSGSQNTHRPLPQITTDSSSSTPDNATRSLHKALALEGLRDWYLRNTLGHTTVNGKGQEGAPMRRRTTNSLHASHGPHPPLTHQRNSFQGDAPHYSQCRSSQLPQSQTFHGHPLHGRSVELSLYQDSFPSKMQELTLKESSAERPSPGTLV
ncbi:LOW QUALITY PROTEIN: coiled-coil domain-containing protein 120 [Alosa alosa]|uniref:LOW QUALITY PROTEIN: coiled-coil domain-containing protein 120 n=1 Tax=Alosa alosa TaxID=278164 RepID=UPI00201527BF|nr:LOW QUALITY PROTEIN: coiled-coil domain-containing protein 120 [Alosa alosa]